MNTQQSDTGEHRKLDRPNPGSDDGRVVNIRQRDKARVVDAVLEASGTFGLPGNEENGGDPYNNTGQNFAPEEWVDEK